MEDHFEGCFDPRLSPDESTFSSMFCARCMQPSCRRSRLNKSLWIDRISTQEERLLLKPKFADPRSPQFSEIARMNFRPALREAAVAEISSRKTSWEAPSEAEVARTMADLTSRSKFILEAPSPAPDASSKTPDSPAPSDPPAQDEEVFLVRGSTGMYDVKVSGDPKVWTCTCEAFTYGRSRPCKHIAEVQARKPKPADVEPPATPAPAPAPTTTFKVGRVFIPPAANTPVQAPPAPAQLDPWVQHNPVKSRPADPWSTTQRDAKVPVGGKFSFGGGSK